MSARNRNARYVLIVHAIVAEVFAIPLLLFAGRFAEWLDWPVFDPTITKMLGAALAALGVGSLLASRDPLRHRVIVQTEIVYTGLSAIVVLYRLLRFSSTTPDSAWAVLAVFVVFFVLFTLTYPREDEGVSAAGATPDDAGKEPSATAD
jgi:hypothetical protein